jgi:hypothetical protein
VDTTTKNIDEYLHRKKNWFKAFEILQELILLVVEDEGETNQEMTN